MKIDVYKKKNPFLQAMLYLSIVILSSCATRNLTYFSDLPDSSLLETEIIRNLDPKIQPGDMLAITVSSLDPITNSMFNSGALADNISEVTKANPALGIPQTGKEGYLVDKEGFIDFPVVGKVKLEGLTLNEGHKLMVSEIGQFVQSPIVSFRYLNFRITVIGAVNRPGTFTINDDHVSVLEALGLAGDMTPYGKRENVLLVREINGKRSMLRLDLNKRDVFNSPFFFLHQNDVVYVEPNKLADPKGERTLRIISTTATIATAISLIVFRLL